MAAFNLIGLLQVNRNQPLLWLCCCRFGLWSLHFLYMLHHELCCCCCCCSVQGEFKDYEPQWYASVGFSIFVTLAINRCVEPFTISLYQHENTSLSRLPHCPLADCFCCVAGSVVPHVAPMLKLFVLRRCLRYRAKSRAVSQRQLNYAWEGEKFDISPRYSRGTKNTLDCTPEHEKKTKLTYNSRIELQYMG
jgi:hypothetical protein